MKRAASKPDAATQLPAEEKTAPYFGVIDCSYEAEMRVQRKLAARGEAKRLIAQNRLREALEALHEWRDPLTAFLESLARFFSGGELTKKSEFVVVKGKTIFRHCEPLDPKAWHGPN